MTGSYDIGIVALSLTIAVVASRVALDLGGRVTASRGHARLAWRLVGSVVFGLGIWSMQILEMLGFAARGVEVGYDLTRGMVALAIAIGASSVALLLVGYAEVRTPWLITGAVVMGAGIAGVHFTGMEAMRLPVRVWPDQGRLVLAAGVAVAAAFVALRVALRHRADDVQGVRTARWQGALLMGAAIAGVHFAAVAGAHVLPPAPGDAARYLTADGDDALEGAAAVLIVLAVTAAGVLADRRMRARMAEMEAVRGRERQLQEAQEIAGVGSWEWDVAADAFTGSAQAFRNLGMRPVQGAVPGREVVQALLAPPRDEVMYARDTALRTGKPLRLYARVRGQDGEERVLHVRAHPVEEPDGEARRLVGTFQDVTLQRQARDALRRSEAYFRALIAHAHETITVVDREGTVLFESPAVTPMLGYRPEEVVGRSVFDFLHPADAPRVRAACQCILAGQALQEMELRFRHADGTWRILRAVSRNLLADPAVNGVVINARDITERTLADRRFSTEHAVTELLARAESLDAAMPVILRTLGEGLQWDAATFWCVDAEAEVLECSRRWHGGPGAETPSEALTAQLVCLPGVGLPGRTWTARQVAWTESIADDPAFMAGSLAVADGFRSAAAFPVAMADGCFGVIELRSREPRPRDAALSGSLTSIGREVGQFIVRRRAEEALRHSERYFRSLTENLREIISVMDEQGTFRYKSPAVQVELGFAPEEMVGHSAFEFIHPDDHETTRAALQRAVCTPGTSTRARIRFLHRDAGWQVLEADLTSLLDDPAVRGIVSNARNVTARVEAEERLRQAHATLAALVENAPLAIVEVDRDLTVRRWNPAAERIFGWSADEVLGRPYPALSDGGVETERFRTAHFDHGEPMSGLEMVRRRRDGTPVDLFVHSVVLRDGAGRPERVVAFFADVGERKRMEEQVRGAQKLDAIGRLAGGIAHDFNNLLTAIKGNAQLALLDVPEGSPLRDDLLEIDRVADRASALTKQLLAFSRKQVLRAEVLDPGEVVRQMEKMLRRLIGADIDLQTEVVPGAGTVLSDAGQMEQVLANLVINASDAMHGGGHLRIRVAPGHFPAHGSPDVPPPGSEAVVLSVTDTGIGMDEATRQRIFEPFFTTKPAGAGTGLGLSTVYGIVQQNRGVIEVDSAPGAGTSCRIYLPRCSEPAGEARAEVEAAPASAGGSETILLVEDEPSVRELAARVLRAAGYDVVLASDGEEGLRIAADLARPIHLLMTDVVMPRMGGKALADRLRARSRVTRVLYMSGYAEDEIAHRGVLEPGVTLLEKPFAPGELLRTVREALDVRQESAGAA